MGLTADCKITMGGRVVTGHAHLEPAELRLTLAPTKKINIAFADILGVGAQAGVLSIRHKGGEVSLALGKASQTWALKIRYPRGRTEKLGVKPQTRIALIGIKDKALVEELTGAGGKVAARLGVGPYDMILARLDSAEDLSRLPDARKRIVPYGMIWAIWPKGRKEFREDDIRRFGLATGLVDVKVMSFSEVLSGLKLVIPVAQR
ncbi:MAG: hypothetical protein ABI672_03790 [Vicinamibacteria bacterium]